MGRSAKYDTEKERQDARKEWKSQYAKSERYAICQLSRAQLMNEYRGKMLRSEQNRRAYKNRHEGPYKGSLRLPYVPTFVTALAALPLPRTSPLFRMHYHDEDDIAEDDTLVIWEHPPPYSDPRCVEQKNLEETSTQLHGRRMCLQLDLENSRLAHFNRLPREEFMAEIHGDLVDHLTQCKDLRKLLNQFEALSTDHIMGTHLLQWKARRVVDLVVDWKALKHDQFKFVTVYGDRW